MCVAHRLASRLLPEHSCKFSRHDFTLAQLFACLVVREFFGLSLRRAEALLADSPQWLADIGLTHAPDHNTLWRAFHALLVTRRCTRMLDLLAQIVTAFDAPASRHEDMDRHEAPLPGPARA